MLGSNGMAVVDHIKRLRELVRADEIKLLDEGARQGPPGPTTAAMMCRGAGSGSRVG